MGTLTKHLLVSLWSSYDLNAGFRSGECHTKIFWIRSCSSPLREVSWSQKAGIKGHEACLAFSCKPQCFLTEWQWVGVKWHPSGRWLSGGRGTQTTAQRWLGWKLILWNLSHKVICFLHKLHRRGGFMPRGGKKKLWLIRWGQSATCACPPVVPQDKPI